MSSGSSMETFTGAAPVRAERARILAELLADLDGLAATAVATMRTEIPAYAAPARATDVGGLPPTWLATGELDLFRDEDVEYASRLLAAGVPTELHVYPGAVHGFDLFAPDAAVSKRYRRDRDEAFDRFVSRAVRAAPATG